MKKSFLLAVLLVVASASAASAQHPMRVHYIDVGQADSILVELPHAAVLIDAGGEDTNDSAQRDHLINYLTDFFQNQRPDLRAADHKGVIDTIIISHPHIDHTMRLFDAVQAFHVTNLIDGGNTKGSGIHPLQQARDFVQAHQGHYFAVTDSASISATNNPALTALHTADPDVTAQLLSGARGCTNANNDSLVVLITYKAKKFLFTGDAEAEDDATCKSEISMLVARYPGAGLLRADVLKADHHGSANGTSVEWMQAVGPQVTVISAGLHDPAHRVPGQFHAWQFGHPREAAVTEIVAGTKGTRQPAKEVKAMTGVKKENAAESMKQAVYCTCWDGDIVIDGATLQVRTSQ